MTEPSTRYEETTLADLWIPLLRDLTEKYPSWSVWKNPESAFSGPGDIDSLAPPAQWGAIEQTFREWATANGMAPLIVCRHVPQGPHFIGIHPLFDHMFILDVKERSTWRGSTLVDYRTMPEVAMVEDRGFRRIRPGAEGVIKLVLNGVLKGGRPNAEGLRAKRVVELLEEDPDGVRLAANWFKPLDGVLLSVVESVIDGGWDRPSMALIEARAALRSFLEPRTALSRMIFNHYTLARCPVLVSVRQHNRYVPPNRDQWFREVSIDHQVDLDPTR